MASSAREIIWNVSDETFIARSIFIIGFVLIFWNAGSVKEYAMWPGLNKETNKQKQKTFKTNPKYTLTKLNNDNGVWWSDPLNPANRKA